VVKKITIDLSAKSIDSAIKEVRKYKAWVLEKEKELRQRLAMLGASVASIKFSTAIYNGTNDVTVRVEDDGSMATIYAEGESVAFIEFGAGAKYGYGHPQAGEFGVGPGTYPDGKGNWDNPKGWYIPGGEHTYGNPPAMAMYGAVQTITEQVTMIAKEVFSK
jgi:hypothetical protein